MIKNKFIIPVLIVAALLTYACQDDRNEHFDRSGSLPDETLYDLIKQDESISKFAQLIKVAGYDSILTSTQTYTVWAPVNEGLSDIDPGTISKEQAQLIVGNHIARFNNSTSTLVGKLIRMNNLKIYTFSEGGAAFGGAQLLTHDVLAKNGLLHTLGSRIPFHYNLYEYIAATPVTSKLSEFINSFDEEKFNEELSIPIDIDESGRTIYDTVTTPYNRLFDDRMLGLGFINTEDSIYTMLIPDNDAWDKAYARISPYFKVYNSNAAYADSVKRVQTSVAILQDLIYRGTIADPAAYDSIFSTGESIIHDPADLFSGSTRITASNGLIYQTGDLRYNNTETWNKNILQECENSVGRVAGANTVVNTRMIVENSGFFVSEDLYIEVQPTNSSTNPGVTFQIPDVLSGKYNIYVDVLPGIIDGVPTDSTRLMFDLSYMNASGRTETKTADASNLVTSGTKSVRMKVFSEFEFPVSNYYDRLWLIDYYNGLHKIEDLVVTTKLMIKTNVTATELNRNTFTRKFRVDRIVFESVRK